MKIRAYVQRYYFKNKREQPSDFSEYQFVNKPGLNLDFYAEVTQSYINKLKPRTQQIIELTLQGYKQQEIGDMLGISQSRTSVILKKIKTGNKNDKALTDLKKYLRGE